MPCNYDGVMTICTDADSYSVNATSIDVEASYTGGSIAYWSYVMYIERWNGSYWSFVGNGQSGSFSHRTPTKVFPIPDLGLPSGNNSCRASIQVTDSNFGTNTKVTPAFIVRR